MLKQEMGRLRLRQAKDSGADSGLGGQSEEVPKQAGTVGLE